MLPWHRGNKLQMSLGGNDAPIICPGLGGSVMINYFLKVIIMVNFRSTVDESFSAKCSIVPCGHFDCFEVIQNKDE